MGSGRPRRPSDQRLNGRGRHQIVCGSVVHIKAHVVDGSYEQEEEKEKGGVEVAPVAGAGNATELTQMTAGKAEEKSGEAAIVKLDEVGEDWDTWD